MLEREIGRERRERKGGREGKREERRREGGRERDGERGRETERRGEIIMSFLIMQSHIHVYQIYITVQS